MLGEDAWLQAVAWTARRASAQGWAEVVTSDVSRCKPRLVLQGPRMVEGSIEMHSSVACRQDAGPCFGPGVRSQSFSSALETGFLQETGYTAGSSLQSHLARLGSSAAPEAVQANACIELLWDLRVPTL